MAGSRLDSSWPTVFLDNLGVVRLPSGQVLFCKKVPKQHSGDAAAGEKSAARIFELECERSDTRVLPVTRDLHGVRYLDFKTAVDKIIATGRADSPISGLVTVVWLLTWRDTHWLSSALFIRVPS